MSAPTQKERTLSMLKAAGGWGLRSDVFLQHRIPRAAARVGELRQDGYEITSEHERQFVRYVLVSEPPRADAGHRAGGRGERLGPSGIGSGRTGAANATPSPVSGESPQPSRQAPGEPPALFELPAPEPLSAIRHPEAA